MSKQKAEDILRDAKRAVFTASKEKKHDTAVRKNFHHFKPHPYEEDRLLKGLKEDTTLKQINSEVKAISRAVMRYPCEDVKKQLYCIHEKLKIHFAHCSDKGILWLLGGSSLTARGGFKKAENFKKFLDMDPAKISSSRLITGLESILTAMGYRMINAQWATAPADPGTDPSATNEQKIMQKTIMNIRDYDISESDFKEKYNLVSSIGSLYVNREHDDVGRKEVDPEDVKILREEVVSETSDAEDEDLWPIKKMQPRRFQKYNDPPNLSWVGAAVAGNVAVRAHTSGTASLTLSAMDALLKSWAGTDYSSMTKDSDAFKKLCGALVIPTFLRGDYHTIAETYAGIDFYLKSRDKKIDSTIKLEPITPEVAFKGGLKSMKDACTKDPINGFKLGLQEAVSIIVEDISKHVKEIEFQNTPQKTMRT